MSYASARNRYVTDSIATTRPAQLLVMLYDRLLLDLDRAAAAVDAGDVAGAHTNLVHAQDIVFELEASLDTTTWDGAQALADLYRYVEAELVTANVTKDAARTRRCRDLLAPLAESWRAAAAAPVDAAPLDGIRASA